MIEELGIILVRGIGLGAIYTLVALSFNVVHSSSGILNFAQGNMFVLGGFIAFAMSSQAEFGPWVWAAVIPLAGIAIAIGLTFQGWITLLPLKNSTQQNSWIITTMAASTIIGAVMLLLKGPWAQTATSPFTPFDVLGTRTPAPYIMAMIACVFWYVALRLFLTKTLTGLAISALSQDLEAASAAGLKVRKLQLIAFAISGMVIGTAGYIVAPIISIAADTGIKYMLNGFIASVVGGMGSDIGAMIGGPLVGILSMFAIYQFGGHFQNVVSLFVLVLVLMFKPEGLFGRTAARRV